MNALESFGRCPVILKPLLLSKKTDRTWALLHTNNNNNKRMQMYMKPAKTQRLFSLQLTDKESVEMLNSSALLLSRGRHHRHQIDINIYEKPLPFELSL